MAKVDDQDKEIIKEVIRNPRVTDTQIAQETGIPLRSVGRKRKRLEENGILNYTAHVDHGAGGTERFISRHVYVITFAVGVKLRDILSRTSLEEEVGRNTGQVCDSSICEIDGKLCLILTIEGRSDRDIVENLHNNIVPVLLSNHGRHSIREISSMRVLQNIRVQRNYFPGLNIKNGIMDEKWPRSRIFV